MDIEEVLTRGVAEVIVEAELREKLRAGKPLRLKMGFDPSSPNLHIGHAVGLRKLRQFQELGHTVVLIVGDWTAQVGDPSGRDQSRVMLAPEVVRANAETYMQQFFKIVDRQRTEVRWQSEWFGSFTLADVFNLTSRFTMQQMLAHETFRKRIESEQPLSLMELLYPLLQAYDSVAIRADVEFGGTDQKFNILAGRELMRALGMEPQQVVLTPLLIGTDGRKMSKSFNNTIDLTMPPHEMYGRVMSMSDAQIVPYFVNVTDVPLREIAEMEQAMRAGANPRDFKMRLAREIITQFHDAAAAQAAEDYFVRTIQQRALPDEMPEFYLAGASPIVDVLVQAGLAGSKSEARRLIAGGGVKLNGERVDSPDLLVAPDSGAVLQVGKRRFARIVGGARATHQG
ncbi:tyrosine--tRNA ligase [Kallotenue papyrolyticum]|uniref:tyrosine--tRNA ligase n=1 Tax=Kallotenue papyrolyticum TaxID=1325125 RepID=UPI0004922966|nr:tyrosine--tRNA ligase [Kallotenue papyrolyticum]